LRKICDFYNINSDYFGNILLASTEAANILISVSTQGKISDLFVTFEKTMKGFTFKIMFTGQDVDNIQENYLEQGIRKHKLSREIYIVKGLSR